MKLSSSILFAVIAADSISDRLSNLENEVQSMKVENSHLEFENQVLLDELRKIEKIAENEKAEIDDLEQRVDVLDSLRYLNPPGNCQTVADKGGAASGKYVIQPDASQPPFEVYCDLSSKSGATTNFDSDFEDEIIGDGNQCQEPYCLKTTINYTQTVAQIAAIIESSTECTQEFVYVCIYNRLSDFGRWVGRTGEYNYYWDGADTGETGCACSLNYETSQCEGNNLCNCDANGLGVRDAGLLTDMANLPMLELEFGDFGDVNSFANVALGPLKCSGPAIDNGGGSGGITVNGAFSYSLYSENFFGSGVVPVDNQIFDNNSGFNMASSTLVVPTDGTYYLTVQLSDIQRARVVIEINGSETTYVDNSVTPFNDWDGSFMNVLQALKKGDQVRVRSTSDDTNIHCCNSFVFSGFRI